MQPFTNIEALIIDMDGVLWHGEQPLPGLSAFFQVLRERQIPFILATNNARLTPDQYVEKLAGMNVEVSQKEILTSGMATALYLADKHNPDSTRIFVIGENGIRQPLQECGFTLADLYHRQDSHNTAHARADIVVSGLDTQLTWDKLASAVYNIQAGARFVATNGDTTLPTEHGYAPGNGAVLAALQAATGAAPIIIGKPEAIMSRQAMALLGAKPEHTVALGDRLDTDILGAVRAGIRSVMVLTGVSSEDDLEKVDYQPTWIMPDIQAVTEALKQ